MFEPFKIKNSIDQQCAKNLVSGSLEASGYCCQVSEFCSHYLPNGKVKFLGVFKY